MKPAVAAARPPKRCTDCALRVQTCFTQVSATDLTWIETFRSGTRAVPAGQSVFAEQSKISQLADVIVLVAMTVGALFVPLLLHMAGSSKTVATLGTKSGTGGRQERGRL